MTDTKQTSLRWPSAKRGLNSILKSFSKQTEPEQYEGGEDTQREEEKTLDVKSPKEEGKTVEELIVEKTAEVPRSSNSYFHPRASVLDKNKQKGNDDINESDEQMVEMAILPKAGVGKEEKPYSARNKSRCPQFNTFGDPDGDRMEWMGFIQDQMDKLMICITCVGMIFYAFYSLTYKEFKPFTYWVCIVALTSIGDNIGNYGAAVPGNKCRWLVLVNLFTGIGSLVFAVITYTKCKAHDEVWDAIEAKLETGDKTWFNDPDNAARIKELNTENPDWEDDWTAMTAVDWGHAWLCFLLAIAEILQAGFVMLLRKDGGGDVYGEGNKRFKQAQALSTIIQSVIQLVVMAIAWGVDVHFVKPDYMAALITAMIAVDRLFDNITNFLDHFFENPQLFQSTIAGVNLDDDKVHCGVLCNQIFKIFHNLGLVLFALYLSDYSQDLYFFIENQEIQNLEQLTETKNWFNNQTIIGDYYNDGISCGELNEEGKIEECFIDGPKPTENANYCTSDPSPWNKLGYTVKRVHCSKYTYDENLGYGAFEEPMEFPTFFSDDFNPSDGKVWGKMAALWGDVTTNYCPEQCSTPSVHFTRAHACDPTLCNFYKLTGAGETETATRGMPVMLQPFDDTKELGESVQDENEKLLTDLQFQRFDLTFLFKFYIWVNAMQSFQAFIGVFVLFKILPVACGLTYVLVIGVYVALFLDTPLIRSELIWVLVLMLVVGGSCWLAVRKGKKLNA